MGKTLIVYFSWVGNTAAVAREIQAQTGFELRAIEEKKTRKPGAYAGAAMAGFFGIGGAIRPMDFAMAEFDQILLGVQIWAGHAPPAVLHFIRQADLSGKKIWLFITKADDHVPQPFLDGLVKRIEKRGGTVDGHFAVKTKMDSVVPVEAFREDLTTWLTERGFAAPAPQADPENP